MTADVAADWLALREFLIQTSGAAAQLAARPQLAASVRVGFQAQFEVLSSVLDFMDERERAR